MQINYFCNKFEFKIILGEQNSTDSRFEDIAQLLRSTGFSPNQTKRTPKYPETFFKRVLIPESFVRMAVGRLRSDDIYNQVIPNSNPFLFSKKQNISQFQARCYPNPEHRCTAFAEQVSDFGK